MKDNAHFIFSRLSLIFAAVVVCIICSCSNYIEDRPANNPLNNELSTGSLKNPVASIEAPAFFEGGVPRNRNLIISFSKQMDVEAFWDHLIITDSMGKNLKEYFCMPEWSNEDTLVEIKPNPEKLIDLKNKTTFDIYVTIPNTVTDKDKKALHNPIDYRYRINDTFDEENPELIKLESASRLTRGELTEESEEKICRKNHINSTTDFTFDAKDSGDGAVWAKFVYNRIYDVNGKELEEPEFTKLIRLTNLSLSDSYYDEVTFDLSDSRYSDGMYKVCAYAADASGNLSDDFYTYYIIRDTSISYTSNTAISFEGPVDEEEELTKASLDYYQNLITFENLEDDVYFTSLSSETPKVYSNKKEELSFTVSWGLSLSQMSDEYKLLGKDSKYELPLAYKDFRNKYSTKDIYLSVTFTDSVGNSGTINSVVPHVIDFFNYEVQDGTEEGFKNIKLNFSDLTNTAAKFSDMPDKQSSISYRVYYGEYFEDEDIAATILTRNVSDDSSDSYEFEIEDDSVYLVYIQTVYKITSKTNGQWCGQTLGPLYELFVDTHPSGEDPEQYSFSVSKEADDKNSGTVIINVDIQNGQSDVNYYPCYSTDGKKWSTYNELSFKVDNPLRAPVNAGEKWAQSELWNEKSFFEARKELLSSYTDVKVYVRILAVKGNKAVYSNIRVLEFTQDEDNIPPEASAELTSHDSMLSFDGRSFKFQGIVREDDLHTNELFNYYYTEYDEKWGNSLYFMSEDQIKVLPGAVSRIAANVWKADDASLQYSLSPVIPVNGLKDGKYMFFAKVQDSYGNESYITLGKAQIGTFKNKLKVYYDSASNQFTSTLALTDNETKFSRNMINIQAFGTDELWYNLYGEQNELQDCVVDLRSKTLSNTTKNLVDVIDSEYGYKSHKTITVKKGAFYRISVQSFNEHTYDEGTNTGVNKINGKPYSDQLLATPVVPVVPNETEYDLYTEETVSNPVYYYVPAADEDMSKFKGSFFKNTVAISSNKPVIINLISSLTNLGSDIDEWERRGKLIKTYYFKGDSNGIQFKDNDVRQDMLSSDEEGLVYYVMVVHFANNTSEISNVYKLLK